jgi:hypothetical protein
MSICWVSRFIYCYECHYADCHGTHYMPVLVLKLNALNQPIFDFRTSNSNDCEIMKPSADIEFEVWNQPMKYLRNKECPRELTSQLWRHYGATTLGITTFSLTTMYFECHYAECHLYWVSLCWGSFCWMSRRRHYKLEVMANGTAHFKKCK